VWVMCGSVDPSSSRKWHGLVQPAWRDGGKEAKGEWFNPITRAQAGARKCFGMVEVGVGQPGRRDPRTVADKVLRGSNAPR
jgi:hypothetical protein